MQKIPYTISYPDEMNQWEWEDVLVKGGLAARVIFNEKQVVEITFLSVDRYVGSVEANDKHGIPCFYLENLVVLKKITEDRVEKAIAYLHKAGYFEKRISNAPSAMPKA